ncbi:hypothetical protein [Paenibacillus agri]|uniref:Uncharacterized protein n=1 Tax=Paenibacillus agri TaxID=2744309 RepID=A0A850EL97_9BACL|nr:hypothetical protein [Paenibacillus agri]NUU60560.1 hypothetical protein [Paenibacillus agri]
MKKRNKYILLGIVILIIVGLGIFYMYPSNTTFKKAVLDRLDVADVSSIKIIKSGDSVDENEVNVTDPSEIEKILGTFVHINLSKSKLSNIKYNDSYWMTIETKSENLKYGITLFDKVYLKTFEYNAKIPKNQLQSYKITNDFDLTVIRDLFEK